MTDQLKKEIIKLRKSPFVDQKILQKFLDRINDNLGLTREENSTSHFCSFFLPINIPTRSVYLGNHIKARGWIPPGGHIQLNESPVDTVKREFFEELKVKINDKQIKLFNLSIIHMDNPRHKCKTHYDFWYLVYLPKIDFDYDQKEFYETGWFSIEEAYNKILYPEYKLVIAKLSNSLQ